MKYENPELTRTRKRAQDDANREGKPLAILDLNPIGGGLFVIRDATPEILAARGYVETVSPT